jgi:hypothetical protein
MGLATKSPASFSALEIISFHWPQVFTMGAVCVCWAGTVTREVTVSLFDVCVIVYSVVSCDHNKTYFDLYCSKTNPAEKTAEFYFASLEVIVDKL